MFDHQKGSRSHSSIPVVVIVPVPLPVLALGVFVLLAEPAKTWVGSEVVQIVVLMDVILQVEAGGLGPFQPGNRFILLVQA